MPEANFNLLTLCRRYCNSEPLIVGEPGVDLGARGMVDRPEEVGADRLVNTVAAHDRYKAPLIVVDFGTATTFDVVDEDGNYCGGVIAPGINLSLTALHMAAAKLPSVRHPPGRAGDRHQHRRLHAVRHLLGLCRADRGAGGAHQAGVRPRPWA